MVPPLLSLTQRRFPIKHHRFTLGAALVACALLTVASAFAQGAGVTRNANQRLFGDVYATATQTFATTTPVVLLNGTITSHTVYDPGVTLGGQSGTNGAYTNFIPEHLYVTWSADVSKATGTTGSCEVYLNGTAIARSLRLHSQTGGEGTISGFVDLSYTGTTAPADPFNVGTPNQTQTVAVYCFSADTSVFSVFRSQVHVDERY